MKDEVFIPQNELILAGVGIGVVVLLLAFLSLYQGARDKKKRTERVEKLRADSSGASDAPPGTTPFFIACYRANDARFFRVYSGVRELMFLYAGLYFVMIDAETPRGTDKRHWLLRSLKMVIIALAGGAVMAGAGVAVMMRAVMRNATKNPEGAYDITQGVLGIVAFCAVMIVLIVPIVLWGITRRCRELDALPLSGLREQSELHKKGFRATPDNVKDMKITLLDQRENYFPSSEVGCIISLKHDPTGRWKIETLTTQDTRDALQACLAIWGRERVEIEKPLLDRLGISPG